MRVFLRVKLPWKNFPWKLLLSRRISIVPVQKKGPPTKIGHSCGGVSTIIHVLVDAYGYPVYFMLSEGQRNDINYAIPVLEQQIEDMTVFN